MSDETGAFGEDLSYDATARVVDARPDEGDRKIEAALRPRRLSES